MSSSPSEMVLDTSDPVQSPDPDEDLPDTQPMDSQDPSFEISKEEREEQEKTWGQLFPHLTGTLPR